MGLSSAFKGLRIKNKDFLGHVMKAYAGSTSVASSSTHPYSRYLVQVICQLHALPHYSRGTTPCTHSTGVWVRPERVWTFLRTEKSLVSGCIRTPYRLCYAGCHCMTDVWFPPQRPDRPCGPASDSAPTQKANAGGEAKRLTLV